MFAFGLMQTSHAQPRHDKGVFIEYGNPFWNEIQKSTNEYYSNQTKKSTAAKDGSEAASDFKMNFDGLDLPQNAADFKQQWHNEPVTQGWTGTCWSYSATSFFESEIYRLQSKKIKLSEMYTAYCEYLEKAKRFIEQKGNSVFAEGSQGNALIHIFDKYGAVPLEAYSGKKPDQKFHAHEKMYEEMNSYLQSVKKTNSWNETIVLETIKNILDSYMTPPPAKFNYEGKTYTPQEFFSQVTKIKTNDYVDILSLLQPAGYWKKALYDVPDNWWRSEEYYNVPLDDFMKVVKSSIKAGYTISIGGDVSEPGYYSFKDVAMVPSYDIPSDYIDENARYFRFSNGTTTDDHGIHVVGYLEKNGTFWFLIKDSGSGARNGKASGYYFYHEDYIKLKMMNFMIHKDAVKDLLGKF